MAQNALRPGTQGSVNVKKSDRGGYYAKVYYRDHRGKRKEMLVTADSKGAVRRRFNEKWQSLSKRMHTTGSTETVTITELFLAWAEYEELTITSLRDRGLDPHIEPHTHHQYKALVRNHLLPRTAAWQLSDITVGRLDRLFLEILAEASSSTAEKIRATMSRMFRCAVHQDWLASNLVKDTDPELIRGKKVKPQVLKPEDIVTAREAARLWQQEMNSRKVPLGFSFSGFRRLSSPLQCGAGRQHEAVCGDEERLGSPRTAVVTGESMSSAEEGDGFRDGGRPR